MGIKLHELTNNGGAHVAWVFHCPGCRSAHQCDARWGFNGDRSSPTFEGSVLVYEVPAVGAYPGRPRCHSYVVAGRIQYLADSTHALAGQTVDLPDWDTRYSDDTGCYDAGNRRP